MSNNNFHLNVNRPHNVLLSGQGNPPLNTNVNRPSPMPVYNPTNVQNRPISNLPPRLQTGPPTFQPQPQMQTRPPVYTPPNVTSQPQTQIRPPVYTPPNVTSQPQTQTRPPVYTPPNVTSQPQTQTRPPVYTPPNVTSQPQIQTRPPVYTPPNVTSQPQAQTRPAVYTPININSPSQLQTGPTSILANASQQNVTSFPPTQMRPLTSVLANASQQNVTAPASRMRLTTSAPKGTIKRSPTTSTSKKVTFSPTNPPIQDIPNYDNIPRVQGTHKFGAVQNIPTGLSSNKPASTFATSSVQVPKGGGGEYIRNIIQSGGQQTVARPIVSRENVKLDIPKIPIPPPINEQTAESYKIKSEYDNSLSYLYKRARILNVPVSYLLVIPNTGSENYVIDEFDIDENVDVKFTTIFDLIKNANDSTLYGIWDMVKNIQGNKIVPEEVLYMWMFAFTDDLILMSNDFLYMVNTYLTNTHTSNALPARQFSSATEILDSYYNDWGVSYLNDLSRDIRLTEDFIDSQIKISQVQPLLYGPPVLSDVTYIYEYGVDYDPLVDYFANSITSNVMPYIQYDSSYKKDEDTVIVPDKFTKIYKGTNSGNKPNYNNIKEPILATNKLPNITINIWSGDASNCNRTIGNHDVQETARTDNKERFYVAEITYIIDAKKIRVEVKSPTTKVTNIQVILNRIYEHIPDLKHAEANELKEKKLSGSFNVYDVELFDMPFQNLTLLEPIFSSYIYIEEVDKALPLKKRLDIHYRGMLIESQSSTSTSSLQGEYKKAYKSPIKAGLTTETALAGSKVALDGSEVLADVTRNMKYIHVNMNRATSMRAIRQFMNIFSRLMRIYLDNLGKIRGEISYYVPGFEDGDSITDVSKKKGNKKKGTKSRIERLKEAFPELFVGEYVRKCQGKSQPIIIQKDEIEQWRARKIDIGGGMVEDRMVLKFPPELNKEDSKGEPMFYYTCPDDSVPYPAIQPNDMINKDIFPYIPCCYKENHLEKKSELRTLLYGEMDDPKKKDYTISMDKILDEGKSGAINSEFNSLLLRLLDGISTNDENFDKISYNRFGTIIDQNSFIHSILIAVGHQDYLRMDRNEKINFAESIRMGMWNNVYPEVCRQEMYDHDIYGIKMAVSKLDSFFDPLLYYRTLEEMYGINIYVFNLLDKDKSTGMSNNLLLLPRHKHFHVRPPRITNDRGQYRETVIILRHEGSSSDNLPYPHCEVIGKVEKGRSTIFKFNYPSDMERQLYPIIAFSARTLTWENIENENVLRQNIYSSFDFESTFKHVLSQVIDSSGKTRILEVRKNARSPSVFVNIPPTAPMNRMGIDSDEIYNKLPSYEAVISLLGVPVGYSKDIENENVVNGLWYNLGDIEFGIHAPVRNIDLNVILEKYPEIVSHSDAKYQNIKLAKNNAISPIDRVRDLRRAADYLIQIVKYLYIMDNVGNEENRGDVFEFLNKISVMYNAENKEDSYNIYKPTDFRRVLPASNAKKAPPSRKVEDVLTMLSVINNKVFPNGKILLYDDGMRRGMLYQLKVFKDKVHGINFEPEYFRVLNNYYVSKDDFYNNKNKGSAKANKDNEYLLINKKEYSDWNSKFMQSSNLQLRRIQNLKDTVQTILNPNSYIYPEPYIYQEYDNNILGSNIDPASDRFYLIQNVASGNIKRALNVCYIWSRDKINLGYNASQYTSPDGSDQLSHMVYTISPNGTLALSKDNRVGMGTYMSILDYGDDKYAAILELI